MFGMGRMIIYAGIALVVVGLLVSAVGRFGFTKMPGDIVIRRGGTTFFFPIVSCIVISVVLSLLFRLFTRR